MTVRDRRARPPLTGGSVTDLEAAIANLDAIIEPLSRRRTQLEMIRKNVKEAGDYLARAWEWLNSPTVDPEGEIPW